MDEAHARERFGQRVRQYRELHGWDMETLAHKLGKTKGTLSRIETGKQNVNIWQIMQLSDILGVTVEDLFPQKDVPLAERRERGCFGDPADRQAVETFLRSLLQEITAHTA